jgi:hypothetical protein
MSRLSIGLPAGSPKSKALLGAVECRERFASPVTPQPEIPDYTLVFLRQIRYEFHEEDDLTTPPAQIHRPKRTEQRQTLEQGRKNCSGECHGYTQSRSPEEGAITLVENNQQTIGKEEAPQEDFPHTQAVRSERRRVADTSQARIR